MDKAGETFLAGAGGAFDQHAGRAGSDPAGERQQAGRGGIGSRRLAGPGVGGDERGGKGFIARRNADDQRRAGAAGKAAGGAVQDDMAALKLWQFLPFITNDNGQTGKIGLAKAGQPFEGGWRQGWNRRAHARCVATGVPCARMNGRADAAWLRDG